jgi:flagellar biosynthesis/type III secretory pathway protein FliH
MGMIRRADLEQCARNALVMNLGDLGERGRAIIAGAEAEAQRILSEARAERDRLLSDAREEGRRVGHADGLRQGLEDGRAAGAEEARRASAESIASVTAGWTGALNAFESARDEMLQAARTEVVRLAAEIATRVTRRAVELDPASVLPQIEAVLGVVCRPSRLTVRVHPDDLRVATEELPAIVSRFDLCRHAELLPDAGVERGSCVATTEGGGRIDADIGAQLDRIVSQLLPGGGTLRLPTARGDAA